MKNKIYLLAILALFLIPYSCNKEEPLPTSAAFTTSLQNNTQSAGKSITFYTSNTTGEFLTYFKGAKEDDSYGTGNGTVLEVGTDSLIQYYYNDSWFNLSEFYLDEEISNAVNEGYFSELL